MKKIIVFIILIFLFLISCSKDYKVDVKSDTSWSGSFANRTVDGTGNQIVDIPDDPPQCVVVQKQTANGYLSVQIFEKGGHKIFNPRHDYEIIKTTAEYGLVSACSE